MQDLYRPDIAFFIRNLTGAGAQRVALNLIREFNTRGLCTELVILEAAGEFLRQVDRSIRLVSLDASGYATALLRLRSYLRKRHPRHILSFLPSANILAVTASFGIHDIETTVTEHNNRSTSATAESPSLQWLGRICMGITYRLADRVIAVSHGVASDLTRFIGLSASRISVIYNPVIDAGFYARAEQPVSHAWFTDRHGTLLVAVARIAPQKDLPTLFRAVAQVAHDRDVRLALLGTGPDSEIASLTDLAHRLGITDRVAFLGFVDNPLPHIRAADLLILSSRWEGLGLVLIEALALGTPVVSTRCPFGPAEILRDGELGALTPVGDAEALATAIRATLDHPIRSDTRREAARAYDAATIATEYLSVLAIRGHQTDSGR
jgi:glycosyltransferase involved in cell wall biosynthesis